MSDTLIQRYETALATIGCHPGSDSYRAVIRPVGDLGGILPYLNAVLGASADYRHEQGVLLWKSAGKRYAFRAHEISIAPVQEFSEAEVLADQMVALVNRTWRERDRIKPDFSCPRKPPGILEVFKLLPGTNCRDCGLATCMAFAVEIHRDTAKPQLCPHADETALHRLVNPASP